MSLFSGDEHVAIFLNDELKRSRRLEVERIYSNNEFLLMKERIVKYCQTRPDLSRSDIVGILFSEWKTRMFPTEWLPYLQDEIYCLD